MTYAVVQMLIVHLHHIFDPILSQFRNVEPQNPEKYIYIYITFISIEFYNI